MKTSVLIDFFGQAVAVHGDYTPGLPATHENPAEASQFEVHQTMLCIHKDGVPLEVDITEMLECLYTGASTGNLGALEHVSHLVADAIDAAGGVQ